MSLAHDADIDAVFRNLRALDQSLVDSGVNKNDRVLLLINACINQGIDTGARIVGTVVQLGFNRQHVGMTLKHGLQRQPEWPNWGRHDAGTYYAPEEVPTDA